MIVSLILGLCPVVVLSIFYAAAQASEWKGSGNLSTPHSPHLRPRMGTSTAGWLCRGVEVPATVGLTRVPAFAQHDRSGCLRPGSGRSIQRAPGLQWGEAFEYAPANALESSSSRRRQCAAAGALDDALHGRLAGISRHDRQAASSTLRRRASSLATCVKSGVCRRGRGSLQEPARV